MLDLATFILRILATESIMAYLLITEDILNMDKMEKNCQSPFVSVFNLRTASWTNTIVWNNTSKWAVSTVATAFHLEGEGVRRYR